MPIERRRLTKAGFAYPLITQSIRDPLKANNRFQQSAANLPVEFHLTNFSPYHPQTSLRHAANTLLIVLFGLLQTADGIVTYLGLRFASVDEVNPVLNFFAGEFGLGLSITVLKLVCLGVVAFLFFGRHKIKSRWSTTTLACAVTFYCWVVSNNLLLVAGS